MKNRLLLVVILFLFLGIKACEQQKVVYQFDGHETAYFQDWLLCGPFPNCFDCDSVDYKHGEQCKGFYTDYLKSIGGEENACPKRGEIVTVPDLKMKHDWFYYHSETDKIPLNSIFTPNDMVVAYAYCQVNSSSRQQAILSVGSNDGVMVFVNGEKVHENHPRNGRWLQKDNDYVPVILNKGFIIFNPPLDHPFSVVLRRIRVQDKITKLNFQVFNFSIYLIFEIILQS